MYRVGRWLDRGRTNANASTQSLDSLTESQNLETALRAVELIIDDDIEGAERGLGDGHSAFHKLGRGTLSFIRATLGFEQEVMKEASEQLYEAESSASASYARAQHDARAYVSKIYGKGSEFALCQAQAQIMSAVVGVLNESLTESIKGFYKLRKSYITLNGLVQMEIDFMKSREIQSLAASSNPSSYSLPSAPSIESNTSTVTTPEAVSRKNKAEHPGGNPLSAAEARDVTSRVDDQLDELHQADDIQEKTLITEDDPGRLEVQAEDLPAMDVEVDRVDIEADETAGLDVNVGRLAIADVPKPEHTKGFMKPPPSTTLGVLNEDADSEVFSSPLDVFIHSGTNLMSGVLSLMISVIPPAFGRLLFIVGFRGDRERGIRMLWQASKFSNLNGGMAGLVLFGWYNGLVAFCDIIMDSDPNNPDDVEGYPASKLEALLAEMRRRYPKSHLWLIEESRMTAARRDLDAAIELLSRPSKSQLKQLEAMHMFERSLDAMYTHRYQLCADSFLACVELNAWSQALYYYIAGSAHVDAYRQTASSDPEQSQRHKKWAEGYFKTAPSKVGKKKMLGRQLPFEIFVVRKLAKWEERASKRKCSFVDAVGVSPLEEMIYLWNGFKKMNQAQLEDSLTNLAWSESQPQWADEDLDEQAILALLRAVVLRNLRRHDESKEILRTKIFSHHHHVFKGHHRDDWAAPAAHYEMAVNLWMQRVGYVQQHGSTLVRDEREQPPPSDLEHDAELVHECKQYIEKAKNWEKYELDARIGMKITAAYNAILRWEKKNSSAGR